MGIKVLDPEGNAVGQSKDLDELRKEFGVKGAPVVADPRWNRTGLTAWDFGDLPESIEIERNGVRIKAFPMIVGDQLALSDSLDRAESETRKGIVRLFYLQAKRDIRTQVQWLPNADRLKVFVQPLPEFDFQNDVGMLIASRAVQADELPIPRTQTEFERRLQKGRERLGVAVQDVTKLVGSLFESYHLARLAVEQNKSQRTDWAWRDAKEALQRLVVPGFLLDVPWSVLKEFPRFFKAVPIRFEKLKGTEPADRQATDDLTALWTQYAERLELHQAAGIIDPELSVFRWMIEEYRVSLFAQRLGTAVKVSPQRLSKQYEKIRR
jgi:ATP-dependent helicase HrpA